MQNLTVAEFTANFNYSDKDTNQLVALVMNYVSVYGKTRDIRFTIGKENFFTETFEDEIRNPKGFRDYFDQLNSDEQDNLKILFYCMNENIFFECRRYHSENYLTIKLHLNQGEMPKTMSIGYDESLFHLLNLYLTRQVNIQVSVDDLLTSLAEYEKADC